MKLEDHPTVQRIRLKVVNSVPPGKESLDAEWLKARDFHASLYSAIANYLVLRVAETDAKVLVRNVSSSDQERTLIDKIKQMEKFRALYFTERQKKPSSVALLPE